MAALIKSKTKKKKSLVTRAGKTDFILAIIMLVVIVLTLYPFLNVLAVSLNDATDTARGGLHIFPREFTLKNYQEIFSSNNRLLIAFRNSVLRTLIGTLTATFSCAVLAYVLSRKNFVFRKQINIMLTMTMYVSGGLIPSYLLIRELGLINNFAVYIVPALISAFNVIVIRSFIEGLPDALEESAKIDGASEFTIFLKIIMPLCMPVLATVALFVAVGQWNSWFDTYLYARSNNNLTTLQYELMKIMDNANSLTAADVSGMNQNPNLTARTTPESIKMAITIIATVPILIVYPFLQKYFVSGLTLGAVKS
ncbi:carbohydrate ABC transporter permease [Jeotgalibaca ciconiae]|uniref:Carbohydrate ABC transporter permease n=1 Tax=Jeotgalibaca ciconiae TaxID=2496265 RepID=A0A3Q9BMM8_9LACT|nr:carbohydrate ABC transporter permease [Jeotgalibaca ciconiae]AZP04527.1 carbohydrate ABC transporter permease [Jeotgalibaca ciconiae]HJB24403.1 carbohydrate ABC transporter permease [Candidatus Jeotgalibaca pullicola]